MEKIDDQDRQKRRSLLKDYYKVSESEMENFDPYNINGPDFNPDLFLNKLLKEYSLTELMEKETEIYRQIQCLDSEMQTLVYENYNKFISATDTIRKMKHDFKKMEEEMDLLAKNMSSITEFSGKISTTLQGRREIISKLSGTHSLLKKLQFLFELPPRLKQSLENENYSQAVRYYLRAEQVLVQYEHMPSFRGIQEDCEAIVQELKSKLRQQFHSKEATPKQLADCVDMLLQLKEPADHLCDEFLAYAERKLNLDLEELELQNRLASERNHPNLNENGNGPMDVLEYVDYGCNHFLSNLCLVIASYGDMFLRRKPNFELFSEDLDVIATEKLNGFVVMLMQRYFQAVEKRFINNHDDGDNSVLVRALDRFHRRLQAMTKLMPDSDFSKQGMEIVCEAARCKCQQTLTQLRSHFADCMTDVRQSLASSSTSNPSSLGGSLSGNILPDLLKSLKDSVCERIKRAFESLKSFIEPDITFATKSNFREPFCQIHVRENVLIAFLQHIHATVLEVTKCTSDKTASPSGGLLLLLSRFCLDMESSTIVYLFSILEEQFPMEYGAPANNYTSPNSLCIEAKECAEVLLSSFVRLQGSAISQMLRKSVETRDWMSSIEPRNVRAVMKRVIEDVTSMDGQVGQLYEEGSRKERSSDSSRRTYPYSSSRQQGAVVGRSNWSSYAPSVENSLISNIQKLFSEKIEIFGKVEFSKVSVMTGIIKISLKTFLECVRLRTFSRNGLQQVQVDTHYLQLYLWRFVSDENLVHILLDEIVGSAINRCIDSSVMMEPSVVEVICDRS